MGLERGLRRTSVDVTVVRNDGGNSSSRVLAEGSANIGVDDVVALDEAAEETLEEFAETEGRVGVESEQVTELGVDGW